MSPLLRGAAALAVLCAAAFGLYQLGVEHGLRRASASVATAPTEPNENTSANSIAAGEAATRRHIERGLKAGNTDPTNGRKILHYVDPMVPDKHFDAPAKSPFMDMMLVPVYGGDAGGGDTSSVTISPRVQQNLGLRTAEVTTGRLPLDTTAVGNVARPPSQVLAELPESQALRVRPGMAAELRAIALPGDVFRGQVQSLSPEVNPSTRTRQARIQLEGPPGALLPGMAVTVRFTADDGESRLLIPSEALIQTGQRSLVMLAEDGGHFTPVVVEAGRESNGQTEIQRGLKLGQRVVVSGQFLIDSEASLKGVEARLNAVGDSAGAKP
jgi:Barrel-sandwich domain of CusB or HlyD membrane-fusion/Heavy metal binding domain